MGDLVMVVKLAGRCRHKDSRVDLSNVDVRSVRVCSMSREYDMGLFCPYLVADRLDVVRYGDGHSGWYNVCSRGEK